MRTIELNVIRRNKGSNHQKDTFVVEYNNKEYIVPLFEFQKDKETPKTIKCVIDENQKIRQDLQTLFDEFYKQNRWFKFKIKNKWTGLKYYELEDERIKNENINLTLPFSDSNENMQNGQIIECFVYGFTDKRPMLRLWDESPCLLDFLHKHDVFEFEDDGEFDKWLESVFKSNAMYDVNDAYEAEDGEWIYLFSAEMQNVINSLLLTTRNEKDELLSTLCKGWIKTIVHSPFMGKMSDKEKQKYNSSLTSSIEICEDFMDAIAIQDKDKTVCEIISSLNPNFYQYRIEKKFRSLAYVFSSSSVILKKYLDDFLTQIGNLGEDECCNECIYQSVSAILEMCLQITSGEWVDCMSIPYDIRQDIKNGILSLCYLIKIKNKHGEQDTNIYISRLYQLLSLYMPDEKEKKLYLNNSYNCLFSDTTQVLDIRWDRIKDTINSSLYVFYNNKIEADKEKVLCYTSDKSACLFTAHGIIMAPLKYKGDWSDFNISKNIAAKLCYDGSLSRLDSENDFLSIRNVWKDVCKTFFTPVKGIEKKQISLFDCDGDEVDIYITDIVDEKTARCKAVDHEEEGTLLFSDLFFYDKPYLNMSDFNGSDGSRLLFKAKCKVNGNNISFDAKDYKLAFAKNELQMYDEVNCFVMNKNQYGAYACVIDKGLFVYLNTNEELKPFESYVKATVTHVNANGNANVEFDDLTTSFDSKKVYASYLKLLNEYCYDGEMTLNDKEKNDKLPNGQYSFNTSKVSEDFVITVTDILNKMSELERNPRRRYGLLAICKMMLHLAGYEEKEKLYEMRMNFTEFLYDFLSNYEFPSSKLIAFTELSKDFTSYLEFEEKRNVLSILSKFKRNRINTNTNIDKDLIRCLVKSDSPIENDLARLVLSDRLLVKFPNSVLQDKILKEIGNVLKIDIIIPERIHLGQEEGQTLEFKTSLVFPPNNQGKDDIRQQSENIMRVIYSMMNTDGGTLYIGVNDDGDIVGLYNDLLYFSGSSQYNENKAKDLFKNHFNCLLKEKLGAENASKIKSDFVKKGDYYIFKIDIPVIHIENNDFYRVGNTVQKR